MILQSYDILILMETPMSPEQKPNLFKKIFGRFSSKNKPPVHVPQPEQPSPNRPEIKIETPLPKMEEPISEAERIRKESEASGRQLDIGTEFLKSLHEKGEFAHRFTEDHGVKAVPDGGTNERLDLHLVEKVHSQEEAPNGYLIGIGAGNVVRMLELFPEGQMPKAMILFDIDKYVVMDGESVINQLKKIPEEDKKPEHEHTYRRDEFNRSGSLLKDKYPWIQRFLGWNDGWDEKKLKRCSDMLIKLAVEGNLVIANADFMDQRVTDALNDLLNIHNLNNVIYLSNIVDHTWRVLEKENYYSGTFLPEGFPRLSVLTPQSPRKNYYVDTLQRSLSYNLRIATHIPQFTREDFFGPSDMQTRPADEIEGPQENILYEDVTEWTIQKIIDAYEKFAITPQQKERARTITTRITSDRKEALQKYEDWKRKATETSPKTEGRDNRYVIPTDPIEESEVKKELSLSYSYENDFIPLIANGIGDILTIKDTKHFQIQLERSVGSHNPGEGPSVVKSNADYKGIHYVHDPRQQMKGRVESSYIDRIPYEELTMAKLYKELRKRVLVKNPDADTEGKNFNELAQQLSTD